MKETSDVSKIKQIILEYADEFENRTYSPYFGPNYERERFETAETVEDVMFYVGPIERLNVLKKIKPYCSKEDFAKILSTYWVAATAGGKLKIYKDLSTEEKISLFEGVPSELLRSDRGDGNTTIKELPEIVTIYRVGNSYDRPSWTIDINKTKAFIIEGDEMLYAGDIKSDKIIAYFDYEKEVVVNPKDIFNVRKEGLALKYFSGKR